jgi:hypothetical protein
MEILPPYPGHRPLMLTVNFHEGEINLARKKPVFFYFDLVLCIVKNKSLSSEFKCISVIKEILLLTL